VADHARLFRTGGSQAVRLPKRYRFEGQDEVVISREGRRVVLEPCRPAWTTAFPELAGAASDFPYASDIPTTRARSRGATTRSSMR
jgi:antitoxin VapB